MTVYEVSFILFKAKKLRITRLFNDFLTQKKIKITI